MVNPLAAPFAVLIGLAYATLLALLPAYPHSRKALVGWIVLLIACLAFIVAGVIRDAGAHDMTWKPPAWYLAFNMLCLFGPPFAASLALWRVRRRRPPALGPALAVVLVFASVAAGLIVRDQFGRSCVFFDYHHDTGEAWCPIDWQATLGYGPAAK